MATKFLKSISGGEQFGRSTPAPTHSTFWRMHWLVVAIVSVVALSIPTLLLQPWISIRLLYPVYLIAVFCSALWGGARSGLVTTILSLLVIDRLVSIPLAAAQPADIERVSVFIFVSLMITALADARKRSEQRNREAERKYRDIFENAVEGIFQTTPDGKFISANPALARIFGFASPQELIRERGDSAATLCGT